MNLDDMSLDHVKALAADLALLVRIGTLMENAGIAPRFQMGPGRPVVIDTGRVCLPAVEPVSMADLSRQMVADALAAEAKRTAWLYGRDHADEAAPVQDVPEPAAPNEPEPLLEITCDCGKSRPCDPANECRWPVKAQDTASGCAGPQRHNARDWTGDYAHENGNYMCVCATCGEQFFGNKCRVICRVCANSGPEPEPPSDEGAGTPAEDAKRVAVAGDWPGPFRFDPEDWTEDYDIETYGNYISACGTCGKEFLGHKWRVTCRVCAKSKRAAVSAPVVDPAGPAAAPGAAAQWTYAEEEVLVEALAQNRVSGEATQKDVLRDCAIKLNRTERSVTLRFQLRLRDRVAARAAELSGQGGVAPQPEQPAPAEPDSNTNSPAEPDEGTSSPTVPAGEATGAAPPPAAPVVRDDDEQHVAALDRAEAWLRTVKRDAVWTLQADHDVMEWAELGWPAGDIALECQVPAAEVKRRFELLTCHRTIPRAMVLDALARMLAQG
jgi:hypothetical protein